MRWIVCLLLLVTANLAAQNISINRENKTIAVTAVATAVAKPDVATLHIGFHNYAETQQAAYMQNLKQSDAILKAIHQQGVKDEQIESEGFQVTHVAPSSDWTDEQKRNRVFEVKQDWKIKLAADVAQPVLDAALKAGANESSQPEWDVRDRAGLQAKAGSLALVKAKQIAEQMAAGLGVRLGKLLYASNRAESEILYDEAPTVQLPPPPPPPTLKIFSGQVTQDGTVYAVFEIE